ncbi:MAG: hypothetical protein AAGD14_05250 [Planctomycetota bacterium]
MRILLVLLLAASALLGGDDEVQAEVERRCKELSDAIEKVLGKKFEKPVPVQIVDEDFIVAFAKDIDRKTTPRGVVETTTRLHVRLRLVEPGFDLRKTYFEFLRSMVAGLYDPDQDRFFVVRNKVDLDGPSFSITAAHELGHAYRDVDKDYWKRVQDTAYVDEDAAIAVTCLAEGDAELIGNVFGSGLPAAEITPRVIAAAKQAPSLVPLVMNDPGMSRFPLFMREMFLTRYFIGQAFAAQVFEKGGWDALSAAFDNPPRSTEQILHPEKYLAKEPDEPTIFEGGDPSKALGEGWRTSYVNTFGEFSVRVYLTEALGRARATVVAEGWDGMRYFICEKSDSPLFFGAVSEWDTEQDAIEFATAWAAWASLRHKTANQSRIFDTSDGLVVDSPDGLVVIQRMKTRVLVADGVPAGRVDAVLKALATAKPK